MDVFFNPEANRKDGSMDEKKKELWNFKLPTKKTAWSLDWNWHQ